MGRGSSHGKSLEGRTWLLAETARRAVWLRQQTEWWGSTEGSVGASLVYQGNALGSLNAF